MTLISEYLAADLSADASADALCIINIGKLALINLNFPSKNYGEIYWIIIDECQVSDDWLTIVFLSYSLILHKN